jgi:hypothetical protein
MTVPASPQSTVPPPRRPSWAPIVTCSPSASIGTPSARRAPTISAVSREAGAPLTDAGPPERAASSSARLVTDFEPGTETTP